jgi:diguanylate cyclase (GGDEF)-like protein
MRSEKVLVVDDEPDIVEMVKARLELNNFQVITARDGEEALKKIEREEPDLVLLDVVLPKMDGLEICRKLREDIILSYIPIIMLTAKGNLSDMVAGIEAGADDYIVKPFDPAELIARTKMVLRRTYRGLDANPLTRLHGNVSITREMEERLKRRENFSLLYLDLDNFKAFNNHYGYERGDGVIKVAAATIIEAVKRWGNDDDFIGHIGGDDFVVMTTPEKEDSICRRIIQGFDRRITRLYDEEDRKRGYIMSKRKGGERFSIMTVSIGVVSNLPPEISHSAEVAQIGAELKERAKALKGSSYVKA